MNDGLREMHESIVKIRNAVRHVRASPGRTERFKTMIKEARILEKGTVHLDVPTMWNSTFLMLENALKFQKAFKPWGGGGIVRPTSVGEGNEACLIRGWILLPSMTRFDE